EDAGDGGLEQVVRAGSGTGEDEAVVVAPDRLTEPFGARQRAEEEEQVGESEALAANERDRLELTVRAVERADLAAVAHGDAVALELAMYERRRIPFGSWARCL